VLKFLGMEKPPVAGRSVLIWFACTAIAAGVGFALARLTAQDRAVPPIDLSQVSAYACGPFLTDHQEIQWERDTPNERKLLVRNNCGALKYALEAEYDQTADNPAPQAGKAVVNPVAVTAPASSNVLDDQGCPLSAIEIVTLSSLPASARDRIGAHYKNHTWTCNRIRADLDEIASLALDMSAHRRAAQH